MGIFNRDNLPKLERAQRTAILEAEIAHWSHRGWRLDATLFGTQAAMRRSAGRAFPINLLLVVVTCGLWLIVLIYRKLIGRTIQRMIIVDKYGRVRTFTRTDELNAA